MIDITLAERIAWQRRAAMCLGELLKLAAKENLPVLTWRIGAEPAVLGEFVNGSGAERRARFEAWKAAITAVSGKAPDFDNEHPFGSGETRLVCGWRYLPVKLAPATGPSPGVDVTLSASIWPDEEETGG